MSKRKFVSISGYSDPNTRSTKKFIGPLQIAKKVNATRSGLSSMNQQAMRVGGWSNPSQGGELKFLDSSMNDDPLLASGAFTAGTLLNGLVPGSTASQRIGRKVTIKSLLVRYSWGLATTSTGGSPLRILIVYDKQANAVAPAITDILLTDTFHSANNLSNRDRFVTISDIITDPVSTGDSFAVAGVIYKKLNLETMYNAGTAGTIGDISSGSIYMFVAQTGRIATASPEFSSTVRIRYTDV